MDPALPSTSSRRLAVVLPGTGYTARAPLLAWPVAMLRELGWRVEVVEWQPGDTASDDPRGVVERHLRRVGLEVGGRVDLVVAKSFGTLALPWAVEHGVPGVWLTPVLTEPDVLEALTRASSSHLAAGGGADPMWAPAAGVETRARLITVDGADHGLLVGDWATSYDAQRGLFAAVDEHVRGLG